MKHVHIRMIVNMLDLKLVVDIESAEIYGRSPFFLSFFLRFQSVKPEQDAQVLEATLINKRKFHLWPALEMLERLEMQRMLPALPSPL